MVVPQLSRAVLAILCCVAATACASWRVQSVAPARVLDTQRPPEVRVTRRDGTTLTLKEPTIEQDTLRGWHHNQPIGIALDDVRALAVRRANDAGTLAIVIGAIAVGVVIAAAATPY